VQARHGIESTIVLFGSARILPPDEADAALTLARAGTTRSRSRARRTASP
jgi:hypothetical protein